MNHQRLFALLALLWLVLVLPHVATRYSYDWDSSQFERGVEKFDVARHQPHPPGYPLWVLAAKAITPVAGHPNFAQVILAILFTIAGLLFFRSLAREVMGDKAGLAATALLSFSPLVFVYAMTPLTYAVDLFASCAVGWFAARLWSGDTRWAPLAFAVIGIAAGFRQSGATFLLPLLCVALWRSWRKHPGHALAAILAGAAAWLAWYVPTALLSGGFAALSAMTNVVMSDAFAKTSVFYGAPLIVHAKMVVEVCIYFTLALAGLALPLAVSLPSYKGAREARLPQLPSWATPAFFALWLAPNFVLLYLFHCGKPGYVLLSLPPLVLLGAWLASPAFSRWKWTAAVVAVGLLAGYFPYERFIHLGTFPYLLLRASPRLPALSESLQREIRTLIDAMPARPEEKLVFCLRQSTEAPNIRTVTYEYSDVTWAAVESSGVKFYAPHGGDGSSRPPRPVRAVAWLCGGAGLPADVRARVPQARKIAGNQLFSFWTAPASEAAALGIPTPSEPK